MVVGLVKSTHLQGLNSLQKKGIKDIISFTNMSGHSHYATIRRQKEAKDSVKGRLFSRLAKAIQIAVKMGGSQDPEVNYKLRMAIEAAKAANLPKENIQRAISSGERDGKNLEEVSYEGYGPAGVAVIVEAVTNNRNRTSQEIKNLFERGGGSLAGPGAVSFNFEQKGLLIVLKDPNFQEQMLRLIDAGVEEIEEAQDVLEAYVPIDKLTEVKEKLESQNFTIKRLELVKKPKNLVLIDKTEEAQKVLKFLENLESHEDVQKVYANLDIPDTVLETIQHPS